MCYHHVKFHDVPFSSFGGDEEQRFSDRGVRNREHRRKEEKKKDSMKSTITIKIPKDSESLKR